MPGPATQVASVSASVSTSAGASGGPAATSAAGTSTTGLASAEAQARRTPDRVALVAGSERLTFAELNARANRLARLLVARGAGPERRVVVALPRTADAIVALLAVFKSGAAYVPVDPDAPAQRRAYLYRDADPVAILDEPPTAEQLRAISCFELDARGAPFSKKELKARYNKLAKLYHPDRAGGNAEKFAEVALAYKALVNIAKNC